MLKYVNNIYCYMMTLSLLLYFMNSYGWAFSEKKECPARSLINQTATSIDCCIDNSKEKNNCRTQKYTEFLRGNSQKVRRIITYSKNLKNGEFRQFDNDEKEVISGGFKDDIPVGLWILKPDKSTTYELNYGKGGLKQIKVKDSNTSKEYSVTGEDVNKINKPVIGFYHPTINAKNKQFGDATSNHVLLYSDSELKHVFGLILNQELQFRFFVNSISNAPTSDLKWGKNPVWPVFEKKGEACLIALSGEFREKQGQKQIFDEKYAWIECPVMIDIVEYFKREQPVGIEVSEIFFKSPGGKQFSPIVPKGTAKVDINTGEEISEDTFMVSFMNQKIANGVLWVQISLSFGKAQHFDTAWVPFYKDLEPRFQIFSE